MYSKLRKQQPTCKVCFEARDVGVYFLSWLLFDESLCQRCRELMKGQFVTQKRLNLAITSIYPYEGFSRDLLLRFKDSQDRWLSDIFLGPFLFQFYLKYLRYKVVFVPSHMSQTQKRGYIPNYEILKHLQLEVLENVLEKTQAYKQSTMHRSTRDNVKHVIVLKNHEYIKNQKILLFDDLVTTGNTLKACYDLLIEHAMQVEVFALFHHEI